MLVKILHRRAEANVHGVYLVPTLQLVFVLNVIGWAYCSIWNGLRKQNL